MSNENDYDKLQENYNNLQNEFNEIKGIIN